MQKMMKNLREVIRALRTSRQVLICSHVEPDGDSVGSQLALASLLEEMGKEVAVVGPNPVPKRYRFLDSKGTIVDRPPRTFHPDTAVILDCSNLDRLGAVKDFISPDMTLITIDHHPAVPLPQDPAYLDQEACSTGELIVDLIRGLGMSIGRERAASLYAAILSDTGGFRFPNTTAKCLATAADLVAEGAKPHLIAVQIFEQRSESSLRLLSRALSKLEILEDNRVALICLEQKDLDDCRALPEEMEGIVDHLVSLKECLVGVLLREIPGGIVKVNLRSRGTIKVNQIAEAMGGGGHPNAAGYRSREPLPRARDQALGEVKKWL